jgi:serine protease Do
MKIIPLPFLFCLSLVSFIFENGVSAQAEIIDDLALKSRFLKGLEGLHNAKKGTPLKELNLQLDRAITNVQVPTTKRGTLDSSKFYENCKPSVLMIGRLYKCNKCTKWHISSASGFAINNSGVVATNYHVVDNKDGVILGAMDHAGKTYVVTEVLAASKADDVALIQLRDAKLKPLPLARKASVGTPVSVISHPDGRYFSMTKGDISRYYVDRSKSGKAPRMAITADYAKGSSGAPVLDNTGAVVGMVSATNSIYYNLVKGRKENLQMVIKSCVPVEAIWKLIR